MLFYDSVGPNPRFVRIFAAERGVELPSTKIDLRGGENRQSAYMTKNPMGQTPALELADGSVLTEITAICEYLDEIAPSGRSLIGANAQERAETRMWTRRIDLNIIEPMLSGFRYAEGLKMFSSRASWRVVGKRLSRRASACSARCRITPPACAWFASPMTVRLSVPLPASARC